ncbi:MAG: hypothetical protein L3K26_03030 [Candidatus Hydrogenedentes bacterium]|nr:hypothetical protein [Candidatus Hydrogenedentota bacterium]
MVKIILMGAIFVISLVATLAGLVMMEGKSPTEALQAFTNPEGYAETQEKEMAESKANEPALGTLAQQLNERASDLEKREMALNEREKQVKQREDDLDKARSDLEMMQKSINESFDAAAERRMTQLKTVAITLESMEPESAAKRLESMPTDEIAEILLNVKAKKQGPILDAMSTEIAARVIKSMVDAG